MLFSSTAGDRGVRCGKGGVVPKAVEIEESCSTDPSVLVMLCGDNDPGWFLERWCDGEESISLLGGKGKQVSLCVGG